MTALDFCGEEREGFLRVPSVSNQLVLLTN
jgi:hypothetical protein